MTVTFDPNALWPYELRKGASKSPRDGACAMDAVSWFAYGRLGDHPECACPVLTRYVIVGQDAMPHDTRQLLKPFIFRLIGSRDSDSEAARLRHLVLAAARVFVPMALDAAGCTNCARQLLGLPYDVSFEQLAAAAEAAAEAADAMSYTAATNATYAVTYAANSSAGQAAAAAASAVTYAADASAIQAATYAANVAYAANVTYAATYAAEAAAEAVGGGAAVVTQVWRAYIDTLDGALNLGKQGDFDFGLVPTRLREFADARR
jgi:hypothetical protein